MEEVRLQKYVSDCGLMSRRSAEDAISRGEFKVNGEVATIGQKIFPGKDEVTYKGKSVTGRTKRYTYIMLNKPVGFVTTMSDDQGRECVADLVCDVGCRVYPVGRLDLQSEGLLLLTDDGALANRLTHPKYHIPKVYHVVTDRAVTPEEIKALSQPMEIDGYEIKPCKCTLITQKGDSSTLSMTLYEGRNRQIRKMLEKLEIGVKSLRRIAIGDIKLGNLPRGKWRRLTRAQIEYLKKYNKKNSERRNKNA